MRRALARFQELADQFPGDGRFPYRMAIVGNNLAALLEVQGRGLDEAEKIYRHNLDYWKAMVAREPAIQDHRSKLALTLDNLASVLAKTGSKPEAEQYLRSAVHLRSALTEYFPQGPHHHNKLAEALEGLAQLVRDRGDLGETRRIHERDCHQADGPGTRAGELRATSMAGRLPGHLRRNADPVE